MAQRSDDFSKKTRFALASSDPWDWINIWEDFIYYRPGGWNHIVVGGAGAANLIDGNGGLLELRNDANANDHYFFQKLGKSWRWSADRQLIFQARFKASNTTNSDIAVGMQINTATPLNPTDGLWFLKPNGGKDFLFSVRKDSVESTLGAGTLDDDTFVVAGFIYSKADAFHAFWDGLDMGQLPKDNAPNDEDLTVTFGIQNSDAVSRWLTIDYIFCALER